jgi:hypothetical protein
MTERFRVGDFVVTHDYRRGFVVNTVKAFKFTIAQYVVLMPRSGKTQAYSENLLSPSGISPDDDEWAGFVKWRLTQ